MDDPEMPRKSGDRDNVTSSGSSKCWDFWFKGRCEYGNRCKFPHVDNPERQVRPHYSEGKITQGQSSQLLHQGSDQSAQQLESPRDSSAIHIKTRPYQNVPVMTVCPYFSVGRCTYGENCRFPHQGLEQSAIHGNVVCPHLSTGRCRYGQNCWFLHKGLEQSLQMRDSLLTNPYFKTKLCGAWERHNRCPSGDNCDYAHGQAELRQFRASGASARIAPRTLMNRSDLPGVTRRNSQLAEEGFDKWKLASKRVGIYADWIDDEGPSERSPRNK